MAPNHFVALDSEAGKDCDIEQDTGIEHREQEPQDTDDKDSADDDDVDEDNLTSHDELQEHVSEQNTQVITLAVRFKLFSAVVRAWFLINCNK